MSGIEHGKRVSPLTYRPLYAGHAGARDTGDVLGHEGPAGGRRKADETLLYVEDNELSRLLWKSVGNADIAEGNPQIEEDFYLLGLTKLPL